MLGSARGAPDAPEARLATARVVWGSLTAGVVGFLALALWLPRESAAAAPPPDVDALFWVAVGIACTLVPASWAVRSAIHARGRSGDGVAPGPWFTGHLVAWSMCEGAALFGAVVTLLAPEKWPAVAPALVGLAGLLVAWPSGDDLAAPPDVGRRPPFFSERRS